MKLVASGLKRAYLSALIVTLGAGVVPVTVFAAGESRLPDEPIPLKTEGATRTSPIVEAFEPFLSTGDISPGFEIPGGAIWQPQLLVWGDFRTALQSVDNGTDTTDEWVNRLNLFGQLRLSGTERVLISARPLDKDGDFTGKRFNPEPDEDIDATNLRMRTLFFEGDFGEVFPNLDPDDSRRLDYGFAIGRQPVFKQEGMLVNDNIDAIGVVRNSIRVEGASNLRVASLFGWNEIHRNDRIEDSDAMLFGVFSELDTNCCTVDLDLIWVTTDDSAGDAYFLGLSSVQRFGHLNTSFRFLLSEASEDDNASVGSGTLLFAETSYTPSRTDNNVYINGFLGVDQYTPAALDEGVGGPLARTGILFAAVGLGSFRPAIDNAAGEVYGSAVGYQMFFQGGRRQLIAEAGFRQETEGSESATSATGLRFQQAHGRHTIYILDGYYSDDDDIGDTSGVRTEIRIKF
jgi:hypothetical protein